MAELVSSDSASKRGDYVAFLSYSHADEELGNWLHKWLESYEIPSSLVGSKGLNGLIGKRLGNVFYDRADLSVGPDLNSEIRKALQASRSLIVLCSPRSARSDSCGI